MKNLSNKRKNEVQKLTIKAGQIFKSIYGENDYSSQWVVFLKNIYSTAKKSRKNEWLYNCQELVLNLTK